MSDIEALKRSLTRTRQVYYFDKVTSTNDVAKELVKRRVTQDVLVLADEQSHGRGRRGRTWASPKGGVWMSLILRPRKPASEAAFLTLVAGVVAAQALRSTTNLNATLKWPNDVQVGGRKVCGILIEVVTEGENYSVIVGVGINTNFSIDAMPSGLRSLATTVLEETGRPVDLTLIISEFVNGFDELFSRWEALPESPKEILAEWKSLSSTLGAYVTVRVGSEIIEGIAEDLSEDGSLIVRLSNKTRKKITIGEILDQMRTNQS